MEANRPATASPLLRAAETLLPTEKSWEVSTLPRVVTRRTPLAQATVRHSSSRPPFGRSGALGPAAASPASLDHACFGGEKGGLTALISTGELKVRVGVGDDDPRRAAGIHSNVRVTGNPRLSCERRSPCAFVRSELVSSQTTAMWHAHALVAQLSCNDSAGPWLCLVVPHCEDESCCAPRRNAL